MFYSPYPTDTTFEIVENLNYLCSILNEGNKMNIEIPEKNSKMQQSILCQFKTNKNETLELNNQPDATINRKIYCLVVQILLNMFRALQCPSSGARKTAVAASGFRMNVEVEVFSATTAENTSTSTFIRKPEAATAV